jgi:TRAP transporter TAXI family solute receptor
MRGWRRWAVPALVALVALAGCGGGGGGGADSRRLSIATGGTGGVYFVYGGGLANLISSSLEGYEATAEVTSASVDNMTLIGDERTALAFTLADTASDAVRGRGSFKEQVPAQALARLYTNYTQVVATTGKGIDRIEDLKGKRVSVGAPNSGTEVIALRILEAAGLDPDADLRRQQLGVAESVQAVKDGSLDAFFWSGGLPTGAVTDLATSRQIVLLPTDEYVQPLRKRYGDVYAETTIEGGIYKGVADGVAVVGVPNYLVVNRSMSEDLAYQLTKLLFEKQPELVKVHPEAENLDLKTAQQVTPLELHPGAQRYYQEAAG